LTRHEFTTASVFRGLLIAGVLLVCLCSAAGAKGTDERFEPFTTPRQSRFVWYDRLEASMFDAYRTPGVVHVSTPASFDTMKRRLGILLVVFSIIFIVIFRYLFLSFRYHDQQYRTGETEKIPATPTLKATGLIIDFLVLLIIIKFLYLKISAFPLDVYNVDDYGFFPSMGVVCSAFKFLFYIIGDLGQPDIPYRSLIPYLSLLPNPTLSVRILGFSLNFLLIITAYGIARAHCRRPFASLVPVALISFPAYHFVVFEVRGYPFFILMGLLSLVSFDAMRRKPSRKRILLWFLCNAAAFLSNPILITFLAGQMFYYFNVMRKALTPPMRREIILHFASLFVAFAVYLLIPIDAAHVGRGRVFMGVSPFSPQLRFHLGVAAFSLVAAFVFRKEFKSALFMSFAACAAAVLFMFCLRLLPSTIHYLLILIPLYYICYAALADSFVSVLKIPTPLVARAAARYATALLLLVILLLRNNYSQGLIKTRFDKVRSGRFAVAARYIKTLNKDHERIYVYPHDLFLRVLSSEYGFNLFDRNPYTSKDFGINVMGYDSEFIESMGDYNALLLRAENRKTLMTPPYFIVRHCGGARDSAICNSEEWKRCDRKKFFQDTGIEILRCSKGKQS
jgi:hypothetical protein